MLIKWTELTTYTRTDEDLTSPWHMALESFSDATHLKLECQGKWKATQSVLPDLGPDGLAEFQLPDDLLVLASCRFGALIGKLGGSSADHRVPQSDAESLTAGEPFAIGSFCIVRIPDEMPGPLFVGFNALAQPIHVDELSVKISGARPTN